MSINQAGDERLIVDAINRAIQHEIHSSAMREYDKAVAVQAGILREEFSRSMAEMLKDVTVETLRTHRDMLSFADNILVQVSINDDAPKFDEDKAVEL